MLEFDSIRQKKLIKWERSRKFFNNTTPAERLMHHISKRNSPLLEEVLTRSKEEMGALQKEGPFKQKSADAQVALEILAARVSSDVRFGSDVLELVYKSFGLTNCRALSCKDLSIQLGRHPAALGREIRHALAFMTEEYAHLLNKEHSM